MKLHEAGGLTVAEVQARLLSGQDDQQIAERCGLTPGCIAWYTALFFDVRSRLDAFGYIVARVIGPGPWQGFENHDVPGFWTWMAWAGGSLVLDLLVDTFHAVRRPHEVSALSVYLRPGKTVPRDLQCLVAAAVLPHIDSAGIALMPLQLGLLEAKVARDPVKAERQRDRVRRNLVRLAREHLAGKPITMPLPAKARGKATTTNRSSATAARGNAAPPPKTFLQELWETLSRRAAAGRGNKSSTLDVVPERASGAQRERVAQHRGGHRRGLGATTQRQAVLLSRPPRR